MTGVTSAQSLVVRPAARLRGVLTLPGDKSISHRALMLATIAAGRSEIQGAGDGADVRSTAAICAALGADVRRMVDDATGNASYVVASLGSGASYRSDAARVMRVPHEAAKRAGPTPNRATFRNTPK